MNIVFGSDEYVAAYIAGNLQLTPFTPGSYAALGFVNLQGALIGGAVFNNYNGSNVEFTVYAPGGMKRGIIRAIAHYVFVQLGCNRLTARTKKSNKAVRMILPKIGFKFEGISPLYFGPGKGDAALLFGIDRAAALKKWK